MNLKLTNAPVRFTPLIIGYLMSIGLFSFQSCCNRKECDDARYPILYFNVNGFNQEERLSAIFHIIRISDSTIIETKDLDISPATGYVQSNTFLIWGRSDFDVRKYFYVMNTNISTDTIKNVSYNTTVSKIKCTDCNPYGVNTGIIIGYNSFSCVVSGEKQYDMDDIRIEK